MSFFSSILGERCCFIIIWHARITHFNLVMSHNVVMSISCMYIISVLDRIPLISLNYKRLCLCALAHKHMHTHTESFANKQAGRMVCESPMVDRRTGFWKWFHFSPFVISCVVYYQCNDCRIVLDFSLLLHAHARLSHCAGHELTQQEDGLCQTSLANFISNPKFPFNTSMDIQIMGTLKAKTLVLHPWIPSSLLV